MPDLVCTLPWSNMLVRRNGKVKVCCHNPIEMGDLNSQGVSEIWHGDKYTQLRGHIERGDFSYGCIECPRSLNR